MSNKGCYIKLIRKTPAEIEACLRIFSREFNKEIKEHYDQERVTLSDKDVIVMSTCFFLPEVHSFSFLMGAPSRWTGPQGWIELKLNLIELGEI